MFLPECSLLQWHHVRDEKSEDTGEGRGRVCSVETLERGAGVCALWGHWRGAWAGLLCGDKHADQRLPTSKVGKQKSMPHEIFEGQDSNATLVQPQ